MSHDNFAQSVTQTSVLATNKLIKNTYILLGATLLWSTVLAFLSMLVMPPANVGLFCSLAAIGILWFVMPRVQNSSSALIWVFAFTGLLGFGLGPTIAYYLVAMPSVVPAALGITSLTFFGLSAYALISKKDFSFMGGFIFAGILVAFAAGIIALVSSMVFSVPLPGLQLAVSAAFALLSAGLILWQTSAIVNGGETNYIAATVTLYVAIYNMFTSLLHILGVMNSD